MRNAQLDDALERLLQRVEAGDAEDRVGVAFQDLHEDRAGPFGDDHRIAQLLGLASSGRGSRSFRNRRSAGRRNRTSRRSGPVAEAVGQKEQAAMEGNRLQHGTPELVADRHHGEAEKPPGQVQPLKTIWPHRSRSSREGGRERSSAAASSAAAERIAWRVAASCGTCLMSSAGRSARLSESRGPSGTAGRVFAADLGISQYLMRRRRRQTVEWGRVASAAGLRLFSSPGPGPPGSK